MERQLEAGTGQKEPVVRETSSDLSRLEPSEDADSRRANGDVERHIVHSDDRDELKNKEPNERKDHKYRGI